MLITINNIEQEVPFDLNLIKLGDFLQYREQYGVDLDKRLQELQEKSYTGDEEEIELNRSIDIENHFDLEGLSWVSFWTKHDLFEVKEEPFIAPLLMQYKLMRHMIRLETEESQSFPAEIDWLEETWVIQNFHITPASEMSFNETITSKEIIRQIYRLGKGKFEALPYLCAIFLRKKGEEFKDDFIHEGSDRLELMHSLPLKHAFQVAFFLISCVDIWSKILVSSEKDQEELKQN